MKTTIKNYQDLQLSYSKEIDTFPLFFAFNEEQLHAGIKKLDCAIGNLISIGNGGYMPKWEFENFKKIGIDFDKRKKEWLSIEENLISALEYELSNHEYGYTYELEDTLSMFDLDFEEDFNARCLKIAVKNYLAKNECN